MERPEKQRIVEQSAEQYVAVTVEEEGGLAGESESEWQRVFGERARECSLQLCASGAYLRDQSASELVTQRYCTYSMRMQMTRGAVCQTAAARHAYRLPFGD